MARIRTIKPEFPQSESMGRVSRDARLLFIQLWTLADDSGRARGNSRMLASLLFPYDDDAPGLIEGWMAELEAEGCVVRYAANGQTYLQVCNWTTHQKIDKPSDSKIPPFDESSRIFAKPRESSPLDQGRDQGEDQGPGPGPVAPAEAAATDGEAGPRGKPKAETPSKSAPVWQAYSEAFLARYSHEPVRNAKTNSQLCQLVDRLGADAPAVAAFYVRHGKGVYVGRRHSVDLLLHDAEALRTDWLLGQQSTQTAAMQSDRTQTNFNAFKPLLDAARAKEQAAVEGDYADR